MKKMLALFMVILLVGCGKSEFDVAANDLHDKLLKVQADFENDVSLDVIKDDIATASVVYEKAGAKASDADRGREQWKRLVKALSNFQSAASDRQSAKDDEARAQKMRGEFDGELRKLFSESAERHQKSHRVSLVTAQIMMKEYAQNSVK